MNLEKIIRTFAMIGADLPAYRALLDQALALFSERDQDTLKAAYAKAIEQADAAHKAAQELRGLNSDG